MAAASMASPTSPSIALPELPAPCSSTTSGAGRSSDVPGGTRSHAEPSRCTPSRASGVRGAAPGRAESRAGSLGTASGLPTPRRVVPAAIAAGRLAHLDDLVHRHRVQRAEKLVAAGRSGAPRGGLAVAERHRPDQPWAVGEPDVVLDGPPHPPGELVARRQLDVPGAVPTRPDVDDAAARKAPQRPWRGFYPGGGGPGGGSL